MNFNLMRGTKSKSIIMTGFFTAIGIVLPIVFHYADIGKNLLPMQFPVLLSGFFLTPPYAVTVGVITPVLSALLTGMPPMFPNMLCLCVEFGAYGLFLSIFKRIKSKYLRLVLSLLLGKTVLLVFAFSNAALAAFTYAQLINGLAGMLWQILIVPVIVKGYERRSRHERLN